MNLAKATLLVVTAVVMALGGCAMTREEQLRDRSQEVASRLTAERDKVLDAWNTDPASRARLDHLTTLRTELLAANVGMTAAKFLPEERRDAAFDVIEQVYDTIEWNIPIPPGEKMKPLPPEFSDGRLNFR
jgi:hypothetical protein